jgi:hypothetical protein
MHSRIRELTDYLDAQRAVLREAFERVPPEARDQPPGPGRWSAAGVVEHLAILEERIAALLNGKIAAAKNAGLAVETSTTPILPMINVAAVLDRSTRVEAPAVGVPTGLPAEAAWAALERSRATLRAALNAGDGFALETVTHPHPLLGSLSAYQWFAFMGAHEARHAAQIRETTEGVVTTS